jgi:hypothetical protein
MQAAAERLLQITSQYGTVTQEGLDEYIAKFELPEMEIKDLTNFDSIFDFPLAPPPEEEPEPHTPEIEVEVEVESVEGETYELGPHTVKCGNEKGEVTPEKMDAYRKKYHKIMTGGEDGWQEATPIRHEEL